LTSAFGPIRLTARPSSGRSSSGRRTTHRRWDAPCAGCTWRSLSSSRSAPSGCSNVISQARRQRETKVRQRTYHRRRRRHYRPQHPGRTQWPRIPMRPPLQPSQ
jgi:hypothetical protein